MYLRTIYELDEEGVIPMRARIAERMGHSGPTVSQTVARMERDGLVHLLTDRRLELTGPGRAKAVAVMRKHRLAERLLTDVIGLPWARVHDEACRWEHVISEEVERLLVTLLNGATVSPYGNPIPGLEALGAPGAPEFGDGVVDLQTLADAGARPVTLARIGETVQTKANLLAALDGAGLHPGAVAQAANTAHGVELRAATGTVLLEAADARGIFALSGS
jgi:DtxR family Mn-dependent transcriptional regulator